MLSRVAEWGGLLMMAAFILMLPIVSGGFFPATDGRGADKNDVAPPKVTVKAVELIAKLPKKAFKQGEAVNLSLEFRNNTAASVTFVECGFSPNHRVTVKTRRGAEAELTDLGRTYRAGFGISDRSIPVVLNRGMSFKYGNKPVPLHRLFDLPPGSYTVEVLYRDSRPPTPMEVASEPVKFTVIP